MRGALEAGLRGEEVGNVSYVAWSDLGVDDIDCASSGVSSRLLKFSTELSAGLVGCGR